MRRAMLKQFVFFIFILLLSSAASAQQNQAPAVPGRLVDLGGFKIHIHCVGLGRPAVILIHGLGDFSFDWDLVQPAVAKQTEACAYDRPGQAWSEPGPPPRGITTSVRELHLLLQRTSIQGPYILVGHSLGGLIARMYAYEHPKEVAGIVLIDSTHEDEYVWINGEVIRPRFMTDEEWAELNRPRKGAPGASTPAPSADSPKTGSASIAPRLAKVPSPFDKLPPDDQKLWLWAMSQPMTRERNEGGDGTDLRKDFLAMYKVTRESQHPLGKIPLIVLSKTPGIDDDEDYTSDQLKWNRDLQDQLVSLSTNSEHLIAAHSGHTIQLDDPDLVITSILRMLDAARHQRVLKNEPNSTR